MRSWISLQSVVFFFMKKNSIQTDSAYFKTENGEFRN